MQLCKLFKFYSNHFLISLSISDLEILAKRVSVLYAVVHGRAENETRTQKDGGRECRSVGEQLTQGGQVAYQLDEVLS